VCLIHTYTPVAIVFLFLFFPNASQNKQTNVRVASGKLCDDTPNCAAWSFNIDSTMPGVTECRWAHLTYCCWMHASPADPVKTDGWTSDVGLE
jgi:hypothetical protein